MECSRITTEEDDEERRTPEAEYSTTRPNLIPQAYPWLLVSDGNELQWHTFYSIKEKSYHIRSVPSLRGKRVLGSSFGWLILKDLTMEHPDGDDYYIFNPFSMENIHLPPIKAMQHVELALLSSPLNDSNCHILLIGTPNNRIAFCQPGDDNFVEQCFDDRLSTVAAVNGKVYGLYGMRLYSNPLVTLDFIGQTVQLSRVIKEDGLPFEIPTQLPLEKCFYNVYLIESGGELLFVHKIYSVRTHEEKEVGFFRVFRVDTCDRVCEELKDLEDRMIFLAHRYGFGMSCPVTVGESGIKGNGIYFVEEYDRNLYVYNMNRRSQLRMLACPPIAMQVSRLSWIMPSLPSSS